MSDDLRELFVSLMSKCSKMNSTLSSQSDLQVNELEILRIISDNSDCDSQEGINLNMQNIQDRLQISRPAISYTLNTLEKKEYIVREIDPKDRRRISVHITREGVSATEESMQKHTDMWEQIVEEFGEENMNELTRLLSQLFEILDNM